MIELHVQAGAAAAAALTSIKLLATTFPGDEVLCLVVGTPAGQSRRLTLGEPWRYEPSPACLAALAEFGEVVASRR